MPSRGNAATQRRSRIPRCPQGKINFNISCGDLINIWFYAFLCKSNTILNTNLPTYSGSASLPRHNGRVHGRRRRVPGRRNDLQLRATFATGSRVTEMNPNIILLRLKVLITHCTKEWKPAVRWADDPTWPYANTVHANSRNLASHFLLNLVRETLNLIRPSVICLLLLGDVHEQEAGVLPQQAVHRHLLGDEWALRQQRVHPNGERDII